MKKMQRIHLLRLKVAAVYGDLGLQAQVRVEVRPDAGVLAFVPGRWDLPVLTFGTAVHEWLDGGPGPGPEGFATNPRWQPGTMG